MDASDSRRKFHGDDSIPTEIVAASAIGCNVSAKNRTISNYWHGIMATARISDVHAIKLFDFSRV